jgi:branched-chain amino acid transport system permease protein
VAGALYGQLARQITPEQLDWLFSAKLVLATVVGGVRHFWGPMLGAAVFVGLEETARIWPLYDDMILGVLLIVVVLAFPRGIAGTLAHLVEALRKFPSARQL